MLAFHSAHGRWVDRWVRQSLKSALDRADLDRPCRAVRADDDSPPFDAIERQSSSWPLIKPGCVHRDNRLARTPCVHSPREVTCVEHPARVVLGVCIEGG